MTASTQSPIPADVLLNGGKTIPVKTNKGESVEVKVRLIPIREIGKYLESVSNLPDFAAFITSQDAAFIDSLDDDSLYEIDALGKSFNDPRVARFLERQRETLKGIGLLTKQVAGSPTSPQTP